MKTTDVNVWHKPEKMEFLLNMVGFALLLIVLISYSLNLPICNSPIFQYILLILIIVVGLASIVLKRIKYKNDKGQQHTGNTLKQFVLIGLIALVVGAVIVLFRNNLGWFSDLNIYLLSLLVFVLYVRWQYALKSVQKLNEEKLIFQNETLKNQVNPHFLFNSLNTLLSLVNTNSGNVEQFIIKLSSIYRYITENSPKDKVPLTLELEFINDFFYLHKIRDEEKIQLDVNVKDAEQYEIIPVSMQLLIENALKHNMATRESPLKISVYVENAYIVVKNNLQEMASKPISSKIGLKNLSERVRLLTRKTLIVEETSNEYIVKIPLIQ